MTFAATYTAANEAVFQGRCQVAMWKAAQDIVSESPDTEDHQARMDWATRALRDGANITPRQLAMQVLRNAVIAADPGNASDSDVQFQVNSIIDDLIAIG